jgi:hypothetical protein
MKGHHIAGICDSGDVMAFHSMMPGISDDDRVGVLAHPI